MDEVHPAGAPHDRLITFVKDRPGHDRRYAVNASKTKSELGWQQRETFTTGVRRTIEWYLANTAWSEQVTSGNYRKWMEANYENRSAR